MKCEVIFTGTELLLGQILNTNAQYLQQSLASIGVDLYFQVTVGDNAARLSEAIRQARQRADLIIIGGGLGPTEDDLSREVLASTLQIPLTEHPEALNTVKRFFEQKGYKMSPNNLKQAMVPRGGLPVDNPVGTAPGIILEHGEKLYILLPGPPGEFKRMLNKEILPFLRRRMGKALMVIRSRILKLSGIGEAAMDERLGELLHSTNPSLAPTAKLAEVHLRITAKAKDDLTAGEMIARMETRVRERLNEFIYGTDEETLAHAVIKQLAAKNYRLALSEVFTGGYIAYLLSSIPSGKKYLELGLTAFNEKQLNDYLKPAVSLPQMDSSGEFATALATGIKNHTGADICLAIMGSEKQKEVYIAIIQNDSSRLKKLTLWGSDQEVKERAATITLATLWREVKKSP